MKAVIVLPTYNEFENIAPMLDALNDVRSQVSWDLNILVVDDNSPDGTQGVVRTYTQRFPEHIFLLTGQKRGLGAAYIKGMARALEMEAGLGDELPERSGAALASGKGLVRKLLPGLGDFPALGAFVFINGHRNLPPLGCAFGFQSGPVRTPGTI